MELIDLYLDNSGQIHIKPEKTISLLDFREPKIILTKDEAKERNLDIKIKKGKKYYTTTAEGIRVPIEIKN